MVVITATGIEDKITAACLAVPVIPSSAVSHSATKGAASNEIATARNTIPGRAGQTALSSCIPRTRIITGSAASLNMVTGRMIASGT